MTARWVLPAWTGPDSPQTPVPVDDAPKVAEGVYDLPEADYLADPVPGGSLSSTGARKLLPPACPAMFAWERDHPVHKVAFDFGSAAHKLVLGTGPLIVVVDADDWRTRAAKEQRDQAYADGHVPILRDEYDHLQEMATAIAEHPTAGVLFDADRGGKAEQALIWYDLEWGIWKRALVDWLNLESGGPRLIIADYKTAASASPTLFAKAAANYGYHQQAAFYLAGARALGLCENPAFVFVVQEKTPPYLVSVIELDFEALMLGEQLNDRASEIFRDCTAAGVWPGYGDEVHRISLPRWATYQHEEYA